jgi:hypothetical protein
LERYQILSPALFINVSSLYGNAVELSPEKIVSQGRRKINVTFAREDVLSGALGNMDCCTEKISLLQDSYVIERAELGNTKALF